MEEKKTKTKAKKTTKRRTKKKAEGLGDTVEQVLEATGVSKVAKFILGEDCGCEERKAKLNRMFPYKKPNCLLEHEYEFLNEFYNREKQNTISVSQQKVLSDIYQRVFNQRVQMSSSCGSCWRDTISRLKKVYNEYGD
jgi:hypothetical protein